MPIDPQTGLDPETGMIGLRETHQPTGAMGAVMSYLNGQKSRDISQALQQHREASAQMAQQQADEFASRQARDDQVRQALAKLGPAAGQQDVIGTYLRSGGDVERVLPWMRAQTSAGAKVDAARVKAGSEFAMSRIKLGDSPLNVISSMSATYSPEEMDEIKKTLPQGPLPVPAAVAAKDEGIGARNQAQAAAIPVKTKAEVDALEALATMRRMKKQIAGVKAPSEAQLGVWQRNLNATEDRIRKLTFNQYGDVNEMTPERQQLIDQAQQEAQDIRDLIKTKTSGAAGASAKDTASKSLFGQGTFDIPSTPAGGSLSAPGGSSSPPGTVSRTIVLPSQ